MVAADVVDETTVVPVEPVIETDTESKRDRRLLLGLVALAIIAALVICLILSWMVPVPNVVGMPLDQARKELVDAGFSVGEIVEASPEDARAVDVGEVAAQAPVGGDRAFKGTEIDLDIAVAGAGDDDGADLPDEPGWDGSAEGTTTDADEDEDDDRYPGSARIDTRPLVPSVQNDAESAALRTLKAAGYRAVVEYGPASAGVRRGYVYAQIPAPLTRLDRGEVVTVWVSTGVPPVNGLPQPGPGR